MMGSQLDSLLSYVYREGDVPDLDILVESKDTLGFVEVKKVVN